MKTLLLILLLLAPQAGKDYTFDEAKAHRHKKPVTVEAEIFSRGHADTREGSVKPDDWDEEELGAYIEGSRYILGNLLRLRLKDGSEFFVYYPLGDREGDNGLIPGSRVVRVKVTYCPACRWATGVTACADGGCR